MRLFEGRRFIQEKEIQQQSHQPKPVPAWLIQILIPNPLPALLPLLVPFLVPNTTSVLILIPVPISIPNGVYWLDREAARAQEPTQSHCKELGNPIGVSAPFLTGTSSCTFVALVQPKATLGPALPGEADAAKPTPRQTGTLQPGPQSLALGQHLCTGRETGQSNSRDPSPRDSEDKQPPVPAVLHPQGGGRLGPGLMLILSLGLSSYKALLFRCPDPSRPRACRAKGRRCWGPCLRRCPTAGSRASRGGGGPLPSLIASKLPAKGGFGRGTRCSCLAGKVGKRGNRVFEK